MNKADLFYYISAAFFALVVILLEGYSIYYVVTHYGVFKTVLAVSLELSFDSFVIASLLIE